MLVSLAGLAACGARAAADLATHLRRPTALVTAEDDTILYVANRASGSIATIDVAAGEVVAETDVGRSLVDLAISPDEQFLLALDEAAGELLVLTREADGPQVASRVAVAAAPQSVRLSPDGRRAFVASHWGRAVTVVDLADFAHPKTVAAISLPFNARCQCLVDDGGRLVVADACGGSLAVIDVASLRIVSVREMVGHNIRGLALSSDGRTLLVAHQILNSHTETLQRNVFWGAVLTNVVRAVPIDAVTTAATEPLPVAGTQTIGGLGAGAGDPAGIISTTAGDTIVALSGVHEVALRRAGQFGWQRERVGRRPTALTLSSDGSRAFVANTFGDSVSIVDVEDFRVERTISLGPRPALTSAERGEHLFYDARLSFDGWYSCHSCHTDGHTNGLTSDNFGDGSAGAPKRVLSLFGAAETGPWAWNGHVAQLNEQIHSSLERTMRSPKASAETVAALGAFVRTLPAPPRPKLSEADAALADRGALVFDTAGCAACHQPPTYTSAGSYEVGMTDELGHDRFNPPSLRGVRFRSALFHDNRAASLDDVLRRFRHGQNSALSDEELAALLAFLRSL